MNNSNTIRFASEQYVDNQFMPLKGKRLCIMGDSISTFGTPNQSNERGTWTYKGNRCRYPQDDLITSVKLHYWKKLLDKTGMVLGVNESWAGSTVSWDGTTESNDTGADKHIASTTRIKHVGENGLPDIIMVYAGTNDAGKLVTLGTVNTDSPMGLTQSQINNLPVKTFADAYRTLLIRLQYYYPDAKIVVVNLTYSSTYFTYSELKQYSNVISELCELLGVKCIDLRKCGMTQLDIANYLPDGIHPSEKGFDLMFQYIYNELMSEYSLYNAPRDNEKKVVENVEWYVNATSVVDYNKATPANLQNGGWRYVNENTVASYLNKEINAIRCCVSAAGAFNIHVMDEATHAIIDTAKVVFDRTSLRDPYVYILSKPLTVTNGQILVFGDADENQGGFYYQSSSEDPSYHFSSKVIADSTEEKDNTSVLNLMIDIGYAPGYEINTTSRTSSNQHSQAIPDGTTSTDNLWEVLTPTSGYYVADGSFSTNSNANVGSITFPVLPNDRICFNSMYRYPFNGITNGTNNGIRITYLMDDEVISTLAPADVYYEAALYGYVTVPSGVNTVNIPVWKLDADDNFVRLIPAGDM